MEGLIADEMTNDDVHGTSEDPASSSTPQWRCAMRDVRLSISAFVVALGALSTAPGMANAGEYPIDFCKSWSTDAPAAQLPFTHTYAGGVNNDCHLGGASGGLHGLLPGGIMQFDSIAGIGLQIPADRTALTISRVLTRYSAPATAGSLAFVRLIAGGVVIDNYATPQHRSDDRLLPAGTRDLTWNMFCSTSASTNCYFPAAGDVHHVYKARLFLSESADPSVAVTGGSVRGDGPKAGPRTLEVDASDADSGVSGITARLDSTVVADVQYLCTFDDWSACRRDRRGQVVDIDTTRATDGVHALSVTVRDAAGNQTRKELGDVMIVNATQPTEAASSSPQGSAVAGTGGGGRALIRLGRSRLTVAHGRTAIIRGRLVDDDDLPIRGATIQIDERTYIPKTGLIGRAWTRLGHVVSGLTGAFVAEIPPGASRALRFSYEPVGVTDAAEARVSVRAGVKLRASRRVVRNGLAVRFTGRIAGAVPRAGVIVTLQAYVPGRGWVPADSTPNVGRAGRDGRFRVAYRFRNTVRRTRYLFRILVNEDSAFAYARAASRPVAVTVFSTNRVGR